MKKDQVCRLYSSCCPIEVEIEEKRDRERKWLQRHGVVQPKSNLNLSTMSNLNEETPVQPKPYSKESQLKTFGQLKKQFDYRGK